MKHTIEKRCDDLLSLSMRWNGGSYVGFERINKDFCVDHTDIVCCSEEQWNNIITSLKEEYERRAHEENA